jgi:NitT/TauT family transport system substrate-binding protein
MKRDMKKVRRLWIIISLVWFAFTNSRAFAIENYRIAWSHYTGWEPWAYIQESGILKKWADQYGIQIELTLVNDYIESINLYTSGQFHGCVMTNMDALTIPAVGGVDSTALIVGDFSNGNDGIVLKKGESVKDLKGRDIKLVALSVSHYLLTRALDRVGLSEKDVKIVNTSDADIAALFISDPNGVAVTWNPPLQKARAAKGAKLVFDSSQIPGEIIDLMVVRADTPDTFKKALTGAWYEVMTIMSGQGDAADKAIQFMAKTAGSTEEEFRAQLKTTAMFYKAADAAQFTKSPDIKKTMELVRTFSFDHGLYGQGAPSKDVVGISFPDGTILGDSKNVRLRFDVIFMQMAADGKL